MGNERKISTGISAGFLNKHIEPYWISPTTTPDPKLPSSDNNTCFVSNIGAVYKGKQLEIGLSSTQFLFTKISSVFYSSIRHYNLFAAYSLNVGEKFVLKP